MKRPHVDTVDDEGSKKQRRTRTWFVRVGKLLGNGYGSRDSVNVSHLGDLAKYSLIIPSFTHRGEIESGKDEQRAQKWLWNVYTHPRYFGLLDLDMDLTNVLSGHDPLFTDGPTQPYKDTKAAKLAFAQRLKMSTFGAMLKVCPAFARLYETVHALVASLHGALAYFSGGGGFRVLFFSPLAWRTVTWGHTYAAVFHAQELPLLLRRVAPTLAEDMVKRVLAATDKNVYDCDKGTKPDLLAHFDTGLYPHPLDADFEHARPSSTAPHAVLSAAIRAFWTRVFASIPDQEPPAIEAAIDKPALLNHRQVLNSFPKGQRKDGTATHFFLLGNFTGYRTVDDTDALYRAMVEWKDRKLVLNVHEIRTPLTRHLVDYDGGPPLNTPLLRVDTGTMETPLCAIQAIQRTSVLTKEMPGLLLSCPPRRGGTGTRAHLIWPGWTVRLEDEARIVRVLKKGLKARWPMYKWSKFLESPGAMRMLFSDRLDDETGHMANRVLRPEAGFYGDGTVVDLDAFFPDHTDLELLELCSLRRPADDPPETLLPLPDIRSKGKNSDGLASVDIAHLPADRRTAVMAVLNRALDDVRLKHDKPSAYFVPEHNWLISTADRIIRIEIKEHRHCSGARAPHHNNNVKLFVSMDKNHWYLKCYRKDCPQYHHSELPWGQGDLDTTALRVAWPVAPTEVPPPPPPPVVFDGLSSSFEPFRGDHVPPILNVPLNKSNNGIWVPEATAQTLFEEQDRLPEEERRIGVQWPGASQPLFMNPDEWKKGRCDGRRRHFYVKTKGDALTESSSTCDSISGM